MTETRAHYANSHVIDATLAALADPARRGAIDLLRKGPRRAGDLADALGITKPAMSRHLRVLRTSGLVEPVGDGSDARARVYQLKARPFSTLKVWLDDIEQLWKLELASFKAHAETTRGRSR